MAWWLWAVLGIALLILEVHTFGGFYLMFFGIGALLVAGLSAAGVEAAWLQWLSFTVLSVIALLVFRPPIVRRIQQTSVAGDPVDTLIGESATATDDIAVNGIGKAELRGTTWTVRNDGAAPLRKGMRSRVVRVEGLTLWIRADS